MIKLHNTPVTHREGGCSDFDGWEKLRGVNPPVGGWRERTHYVVEVKFSSNNPPFRDLFFSGFLHQARGSKHEPYGVPAGTMVPCGYNRFFSSGGGYHDVYWLNVIAELPPLGSAEYGMPVAHPD